MLANCCTLLVVHMFFILPICKKDIYHLGGGDTYSSGNTLPILGNIQPVLETLPIWGNIQPVLGALGDFGNVLKSELVLVVFVLFHKIRIFSFLGDVPNDNTTHLGKHNTHVEALSFQS